MIQQQHQQQRTKINTKTNTTTTGVSFHPLVKVKLTLHLQDYTEEEVEACWLTATEYTAIQNRIFMTLDLMHLSPTNSILLSSVCMRGLENLSSCVEEQHQGLEKSTRIRRRNAVLAVLYEQDRQQYEIATSTTLFFYDDSKIREASRKYTRISEDLAAVMGQCDHKAVSKTDENLFRNANNKSE